MTQAGATRRIAVCVDDFGQHAGVNRAALALVALQRATVLSALTEAPAWREGAAAAREHPRERLDVGLHFNLSESIGDAVALAPLPRLLTRAALRALPRAAVRARLERQLDAFETAMGRAPSHLDGHQHVHQLPLVRDIVFETLARRYPGQWPWLRSCRRPLRSQGLPAPGKSRLIAACGAAALDRACWRRDWPISGALLGVHDFRVRPAGYAARLARWLMAAGEGDLLMCHPGVPAPAGAMATSDPLGAARAAEFAVLQSPAFAALLAAQGIELWPMSALLPRAGPSTAACRAA